MQVLELIPLTDDTCAHPVLHELLHVRVMKITSQACQCTLNPFVPVLVHRPHDFLYQGRSQRDVEPPCELDHAIHHRPQCLAVTSGDVPTQGDEGRIR
jgi:hypothetical protein